MSTRKIVEPAAVEDARRRGMNVVKTTPLDLSTTFSKLCDRQIFLKLENLQKTGSFKVRGALNKIQKLDEGTRARGVITASAGNHAQGVAYAAQSIGTPVTVVMPETAPFSKSEATKGYGADVVLHGHNYPESLARAKQLAQERGATFVDAFDDADIIAGQGTIGLELLEQLPDFDTVVVPVGGGGLISGIATALRGSGCKARIIGAQATGIATLSASLAAGQRTRRDVSDTIADGLATGGLGTLPFEIAREAVDDAVEVSEEEIAGAILLLLERAKTVVEGAGAVGLAACLAGRIPRDAKKVVVVLSGGNIDLPLLDRIINLGLAYQGRLLRYTTVLVDQPAEVGKLVACVAATRAGIRRIRFDRVHPELPPMHVRVTLDLDTSGQAHLERLETELTAAGFPRVARGSGADSG